MWRRKYPLHPQHDRHASLSTARASRRWAASVRGLLIMRVATKCFDMSRRTPRSCSIPTGMPAISRWSSAANTTGKRLPRRRSQPVRTVTACGVNEHVRTSIRGCASRPTADGFNLFEVNHAQRDTPWMASSIISVVSEKCRCVEHESLLNVTKRRMMS